MQKEAPKPPVIFLAFANEYRGRHLKELFNEANDLKKILWPYSLTDNPEGGEKLICELIIEENVRINDIYEYCEDPKYRDRICIFHYGGHADGYQLMLQGKDGENETAHGAGLVSALSKLKNLKLIFLNGCSTQKMAQDLVERGVPAVIGTSESIADKAALELSRRFYRGLAAGFTLSGAWELAKDKVTTEVDTRKNYRGFYRPEADNAPERFPWDVEFRDEAARELFEEWNLPKEARNPLFGLPQLKKLPTLPESPFRFLQPYGPEHAELFFGRARYIRDLYFRIADDGSPSILLLYGESGAGKSSLLHAGLVPRLEAARDADTQKPLYKVLYRRREKDLMLVGTLYDMLASCQAEFGTAPRTGEPGETERDDPDREKIEQLEAMARELDEEARAYFMASIERFKAARTYRASREYQQDRYQLEGVDEKTGPMIRELWRDIEKRSGRKLILILDQVEEIFTDPGDKVQEKGELEDLLKVLKEIFAPPEVEEDEAIKGKIILGYREEFNAKIEARFKDFSLARSLIFLEQLNREDILEVFQSLENSEPNSHLYHITIEDRLPVVIADDLLKGKEQVAPGAPPVAPVLQLILKKLWEKAVDRSAREKHEPQFTVGLYDTIQSADGKVMEEFFDEAMAGVEAVYPDLVESGLALDILRFHVSKLGTSDSKSLSTIRDQYYHIPELYPKYPADIIDKLVEKLKDVFLLTDSGRERTSLPHDTLAPIVLKKFGSSERFGQRSARILDTKRPEYVKAREKNDKKVRLDDNDLDVVEGGIPGMRALVDVESELLDISRKEREKRLRLRRILIQGGIVTGLFILALTVAAAALSVSMLEQLRTVVVDRAHEKSVAEKEKQDKTNAIELAGFAYLESAPDRTEPVRTDVLQNLYDLYQRESYTEQDLLPMSLYLPSRSRIRSMKYDPDLGALVGLDNGRVVFRPIDGRDTIAFQSTYISGDYQVDFTADGKYIQLLSQTNPMSYYLLGGKDLVTAPYLEIYLDLNVYQEEAYDLTEAEAPENYILLGYYDFFIGKFVDLSGITYNKQEFIDTYFPETNVVHALSYHDVVDMLRWPVPEETFNKLFDLKLLDEGKNLFLKKAYEKVIEEEKYGWGTVLKDYTEIEPYLENDVIPLRKTGLTWAEKSYLELWDPYDLEAGPQLSLPVPEELTYIRAIDSSHFLTVSEFIGATIRNDSGFVTASLAHEDPREIAVSPDSRFVVTISRDSVRLWGIDGELLQEYRHPNVSDYRFSADGSRLLTFSARSVCVLEPETSNFVTPFTPEDTLRRVVTARFHPDGRHLVIGLSGQPEPGNKVLRFLKNLFWKNEAQILFRDLDYEKTDRTFKVAATPLIDAGISDDGQYAVALTPWQAVIIKGEKDRKTASKVHARIALDFEKEILLSDQITLSPAGKYIVKLESEDHRLDVHDITGEPVNAYTIQDQFHAGFNGQILTPDDQYLVISKSNEILFWNPRDSLIRKWVEDDAFELTLEEKQAYEIDSINDLLPGSRESRNWGVGAILLSLIFILMLFSGYFVQFIQQRKYLTLGLFLGGFLLLALTMHAIWTFFDAKKLFLYALSWTTLAILAANAMFYFRQQKFGYLAALAVVALLVTGFTGRFYLLEKQRMDRVEEKYQNDLLAFPKKIKDEYRDYKGYYDSYRKEYFPEKDSTQELTPAEIEYMLADWGFEKPELKKESEWKYALSGLLALLCLAFLIGLPLLKFFDLFNKEEERRAFRWLLLPAVYASLGFWTAFQFFTRDETGESSLYLLLAVCTAFLLFLIIRQSRLYIRNHRYGPLAVYGIATFFTAFSGFLLAPAAAFIKGIVLRQRADYRRAFLFNSLGAFTLAGGTMVLYRDLLNEETTGAADHLAIIAAGAGILAALVLLLMLLFFGLRQQLRRLSAKKAANRPRGSNRFAVFGLLIAASVVGIFGFGLLSALFDPYAGEELYAADDYYADPYFEDNLYRDPTYFPEADTLTSDEFPETETEDSLTEDAGEFEPDELVEPEETALPEEVAETEPPAAPVDISPALLQLVVDLFDPEEQVRDKARIELTSFWKNDPGLVPALIEMNYENPEQNEGIWNTLFIVEQLTDEQLQSHSGILLPYLDWTAGKGYGPSTMERIRGLRERVQ